MHILLTMNAVLPSFVEGFNSMLAMLRGLPMGVGTRFALAAATPRALDRCGVASVGRQAGAWSARVGAGWNETFPDRYGPGVGPGRQRVDESGELV